MHAGTLLTRFTLFALRDEVALIFEEFGDLGAGPANHYLWQVVLLLLVWVQCAVVLLYWCDLLRIHEIRLGYSASFCIQLVRPKVAFILG